MACLCRRKTETNYQITKRTCQYGWTEIGKQLRNISGVCPTPVGEASIGIDNGNLIDIRALFSNLGFNVLARTARASFDTRLKGIIKA